MNYMVNAPACRVYLFLIPAIPKKPKTKKNKKKSKQAILYLLGFRLYLWGKYLSKFHRPSYKGVGMEFFLN